MANDHPRFRIPRPEQIEGRRPLECRLPRRPQPDRGRGRSENGLTLAVPDMGHRISIPPGAIREDDGEVEFELAHVWSEDEAEQLLVVAAHRVTGGGDRTGYRFGEKVRIRISWARCNVHPNAEDIRVYKTSDGGETWRAVDVPAPERGHPFVEFEDDSFSGYVVST
jgi:hypothetical protein